MYQHVLLYPADLRNVFVALFQLLQVSALLLLSRDRLKRGKTLEVDGMNAFTCTCCTLARLFDASAFQMRTLVSSLPDNTNLASDVNLVQNTLHNDDKIRIAVGSNRESESKTEKQPLTFACALCGTPLCFAHRVC